MTRILKVLTALVAMTGYADATEICGNGIDDDGNGMIDDNCYSPMVTGVCESPLSCGDTGMVSWSTGSLHYDLPPDIDPAVPYGPRIGFRRFVTPSYSPGTSGPSSVAHQPLGAGWQHTYMTWVNHIDTTHIALHTSQGRDVLYTRTAVNGCIETYTPQAGDHVMSMQNDTCKQLTTVQLLTGESLLYNSFGQISQIQDTMPTPNTVTILWTGTTAGNVSTVTDASGTRRLLFGYNTNNLLTSVQFQLNMSGFWTPEQTVAFDYTNGITRDATSQWFVPQSTTEWTGRAPRSYATRNV